MKRPPKYKNIRTEYNGQMYDSKREAKHAKDIDLLIRAGQVKSVVRQVRFKLPGNVSHYVDFMLILPDSKVRFVESKGIDLAMGRMKRHQVEELYKIEIEVWRK